MNKNSINTCYSLYDGAVDELFTGSQKYKIVDTISSKFDDYFKTNGKQYRFIEAMVDELYFSEVEHFKNTLKQRITDDFLEQVDILSKKVKSDPENTKSHLAYFEQSLSSRNRTNLFEEVNHEFISDFSRKLMQRFEPFGSKVEETIRYDFIPDVNKYLENTTSNMMEEFNGQIKDISNIAMEFAEMDIKDLTTKEEKPKEVPYIKEFSELSQLFGYNLVQEGDKIFIEKNDIKYEVKQNQNGFIGRVREKAGILFENNNIIFYDPAKYRKITYDGELNVRVESTLDCNATKEIRFNDGNCEILYNEKLLDDPEHQIFVIESIKNDYPNIYEIISKNNKMNATFDQVKKQSDKEELYSIQNGQIVINPNKKEEFYNRMFIAGYSLEEVDGVLFAIDSNGVKDKLTEKDGRFSLENNPNIRIIPDEKIIGNSIVPKCMQIYDNNAHTSLLINSSFNLFQNICEPFCSIKITNDGIKYEGDTLSPEEVKEFFIKNFPNVMSYVNSNKKWNEFSIPKEEVHEEIKEEVKEEEVKEIHEENIDLNQSSGKFKSIIVPKKEEKTEMSRDEMYEMIVKLQMENAELKAKLHGLDNTQNVTPML